jgi:hypothetical protein
MEDETRKMLKVFGVSVTDFDREAEALLGRIRALGGEGTAGELLPLFIDLSELLLGVSAKWLEVTRHIFEGQARLLGEATAALKKSS